MDRKINLNPKGECNMDNTAVFGLYPDYSSRRLMEEILANEEEHAEDMKNLLETIGKEERQRER